MGRGESCTPNRTMGVAGGSVRSRSLWTARIKLARPHEAERGEAAVAEPARAEPAQPLGHDGPVHAYVRLRARTRRDRFGPREHRRNRSPVKLITRRLRAGPLAVLARGACRRADPGPPTSSSCTASGSRSSNRTSPTTSSAAAPSASCARPCRAQGPRARGGRRAWAHGGPHLQRATSRHQVR